jgi:hypothetical protein
LPCETSEGQSNRQKNSIDHFHQNAAQIKENSVRPLGALPKTGRQEAICAFFQLFF